MVGTRVYEQRRTESLKIIQETGSQFFNVWTDLMSGETFVIFYG